VAIEAEVGQEFAITLQANPTTGYRWQLAEPLDDVLELVNSEYKGPETELVGAGGEEVWTFRGVCQGEAIVTLHYVRPWEHGIAPTETRTFTVIIH